jgi:hypothetical protein
MNLNQFINQCITGKAITKCFADWVMKLSPFYQLELIKTWLNGDGGIFYCSERNNMKHRLFRSGNRNKWKITGTTASKVMAIQLYHMALRCQLHPCIKYRKSHALLPNGNERHSIAYDVYFTSLSDVRKLLEKSIKGRNCSQRKWDKYKMITPITKIETIPYSGVMIDITCDNHFYFTENGIVVHNCDPPYAKGGQNYIRINGLDIQWSPVHYIELLQSLVHIKGKFLLSTDILDNLYPKWHIRTINRINNFSPIKSELRTTDKEYLISNYDPAIVQTQSEKNQSTLNGFVKKERIENDFET